MADVVLLATQAGPVSLYPALKVEPDATSAEFDRTHPEGADYVTVPTMSRDDVPAADAWSRTYHLQALTFASAGNAVITRGGARIIPDRVAASWDNRRSHPIDGRPPAEALDGTLRDIAGRYGSATAKVVAMQPEYAESTRRCVVCLQEPPGFAESRKCGGRCLSALTFHPERTIFSHFVP